jgi:hypothetical protein
MAPINFGCVNICGVSREYQALKIFIDQDNISILGISETKIRFVKIHNFTSFKKKLTTHPSNRGVALIASDIIPSQPHQLLNHLGHEAVPAKVQINNQMTLIISYYNPPLELTSSELLNKVALQNHAIILGDFNARRTYFCDSHINQL